MNARVTQLLAEVPGGIAGNVNIADAPLTSILEEVVDSDAIPGGGQRWSGSTFPDGL